MITYEFNDRQGNRDRACRIVIIHDGIAYSQDEAIEKKMASFSSLEYTKDGKWSNTTWRVAVNTARLIVCMSPFGGWSDDLDACLEHLKRECAGYIGYTPTDEEAKVAFASLYPRQFNKVMGIIAKTSDLI